jgi:hypothetical protein
MKNKIGKSVFNIGKALMFVCVGIAIVGLCASPIGFITGKSFLGVIIMFGGFGVGVLGILVMMLGYMIMYMI